MIIYRHSHILRRITNHLTYKQKFYLIVMFFLICNGIFAYTMLRQINEQLNFSYLEQIGSRYQKPLRKILENVILHKELAQSYHKGKIGIKNDILSLQSMIGEEFRKLETVNKEAELKLKTREEDLYPLGKESLQSNHLLRGWDNIKKQVFEADFTTLNGLYNDLITNILGLINYVDDSSHLNLDSEARSFFLIEGALVTLPETEFNLSQIMTLSDEVLAKKDISTDDKIKVAILKNRLVSELDSIQTFINKSIPNISNPAKHDDVSAGGIDAALGKFMAAGNKFLSPLDAIIKSEEQLPLPDSSELAVDGNRAISAGFALWDEANSSLDGILDARVKSLQWTRNISMLVGFLISMLGFFLGLFFINEVIRSVRNLDDTIRRLTAGDLTARVPIIYQDELGRASIAFNRMADSFERIITQLRNLLDATKRLSDGDFSARVSFEGNDDDEISQISLSFNNMAQTFEEIISQLHQLGINLTTSATEIATASKQQETIIVEQEATTREISVTANEISTTAKEFANTVSEVSKVGEQTSTLASAGKDSLSHMEVIMRQMVDASGSIASKLAVLNEKAGNITSVITTITKVADQTNLLSLNAAIEAEKAGEYGRSFSVIAREIRRLADQTALATLDIEKIVNEIMSAVSSSVMGVDDFTQEIRNGVQQVETVGQQLATIIEQVQVLTKRFETVNQGMQTQSAAAEQINEAMAQLSHTARLTTETRISSIP